MFEIREYDNGGYSVLFDTDFEFNCFRHYLETKFDFVQVCIMREENNLLILIGKKDDTSSFLDDFTIKRIQKEIEKEIGCPFIVKEKGLVLLDDYKMFTATLLIDIFTQKYTKDVDFEEEEVVLEDGEVEIQNIVYCDDIPDFVFEVMDSYYEV
jgi:hypothetical protein